MELTYRKLHMGFPLVPKSDLQRSLNGIMAIILVTVSFTDNQLTDQTFC